MEEIQADALSLLIGAGLLTLPIDVRALCCWCGLRVEPWPLPRTVAGLLYRGPLRDEIVYNRDDPSTRQRFTIAHEFAHWKLGHIGRLLLSRSEDWSGAETDEERQANELAAGILMPEPLLREKLRCGLSPGRLCTTFRVSQTAMLWRVQTLVMHDLEID